MMHYAKRAHGRAGIKEEKGRWHGIPRRPCTWYTGEISFLRERAQVYLYIHTQLHVRARAMVFFSTARSTHSNEHRVNRWISFILIKNNYWYNVLKKWKNCKVILLNTQTYSKVPKPVSNSFIHEWISIYRISFTNEQIWQLFFFYTRTTDQLNKKKYQ